jgi:hypothetical protein
MGEAIHSLFCYLPQETEKNQGTSPTPPYSRSKKPTKYEAEMLTSTL